MVLDLFEARVAIEVEAVRLAFERADDADLHNLVSKLEARAAHCKTADATELLNQDEVFHTGIVLLTKNAELLRMLENLNARTRYIRLKYHHQLRVFVAAPRRLERGLGRASSRIIIDAGSNDQALLPARKRVWVMTVSKSTLSANHLIAAGAPPHTPIIGSDQGSCFTRDILGDVVSIDFAAARQYNLGDPRH